MLNTPGNIANKPEVMARLRDSTLAAVRDPSDATVRRRVEFLFHHTEMVTDELVNLRRAVYSRPGFLRAISNTLVLQDPEVRKDFAWDPGWVGKITAPTLLLWTDHDPTGGLDEAAMLLELAARRPAARHRGRRATGRSGRSATSSCASTATSCCAATRRRRQRPRAPGTVVSEIIGLVGMSHSPFATHAAAAGPRPRPAAGSWPTRRRVAAAVAALAPDARGGHRPRPLPRQLLRRDAAVRARRGGGRGLRRLRQPPRPAAGRVRARLVDPRRAGRATGSTSRCPTR